jgi:predicted PurR-regulated permease PerM
MPREMPRMPREMPKAVTSNRPMLPDQPSVPLSPLAFVVVIVAVLYVAKDVFLPLALAMLIAFALSPLVTRLRRIGLPSTAGVIVAVMVAFLLLGAFSLVVASQLSQLAGELPAYQSNILQKLDDLGAMDDSGELSRLSRMVSEISAQLTSALSPGETNEAVAEVRVIERTSALETIENVLLPLFGPVAMTGLVVVLVIFMLMQREDLRDRFIRLVGARDLARTTQVIEDAAGRVTTYLLMQLLVNTIYATPIGLGLWAIGIPNPLLWALFTLVLRFVPYIGSILSAALPLMLAFAVSPGWAAVLWTLALFAFVEFVTSNAIEPWLYGSRTGVSPLAIIVAAIFWTFIWGPLGLVLSTPLTVCLVVLGRHVPQFALFDVLFGDEPVLSPHAQLYQRLLAGDEIEAQARAEEALEDMAMPVFVQNMLIPALLLAQDDRDKGMLSHIQEERFARLALSMVDDIERTFVADAPDQGIAQAASVIWPTDLVCIGGRWLSDDVSAAALAVSLRANGAEARSAAARNLAPARMDDLALTPDSTLILCFLDPSPSRASLLHVRRLKRAFPTVRIGVLIWAMPHSAEETTRSRQLPVLQPDQAKLAEAKSLGADFTATTVAELETAIGSDDAPPDLAPKRSPAGSAQPTPA